ncbi:DUF982 domain-containing protein [Rhizobium cauense]|uniref:DUF982 domain-containing protein n=1 Tax=Rhizobium cauense TaxID=1166683 RepID=UPI001CB7987F|nr:DUF982 domain-containing protein [Rhizobium cauense]
MGKTSRAGRQPHSYVVGSPEEALTWLIHEPNQSAAKWQRAWKACQAVVEGRMKTEDAKSTVRLAAAR